MANLEVSFTPEDALGRLVTMLNRQGVSGLKVLSQSYFEYGSPFWAITILVASDTWFGKRGYHVHQDGEISLVSQEQR